ncbi:MAG: TatD family hydrolase [Tannerellaceae bacterium]|nr:TatD family hydrolase [Tannerellaceae bacterium]
MIFCNIHTHHIPEYPDNILTIVNRIIGKDSFPGYVEKCLYWSIGIHPWYISGEKQQWQELLESVKCKNVVAIGEAGLDKMSGSPMERQIDIFKKQAFLSEELQKPLLIHCVKAWDELLVVKKQVQPEMPWIIHGFRGNPLQAG